MGVGEKRHPAPWSALDYDTDLGGFRLSVSEAELKDAPRFAADELSGAGGWAQKVRAFYDKLFHGPGIFAERLDRVQPLASEDPAIAEILTFIGDGKHRPLCLPDDRAGRP